MNSSISRMWKRKEMRFDRKNKWKPERSLLEANVESLEARVLLSVSPANLTADSVQFTGTAAVQDQLFLRLNSNTLEFSQTGAANSYSSDLDAGQAGVQSLVFSSGTSIDIDLGVGDDTIHIDASLRNAIASTGGTLSFSSGLGSTDTLVGPDGAWEIIAGPTGLLGLDSGSGQLTGGANSLSMETSGRVAVDADVMSDSDLTVLAAEQITIAEGVTVSSRQVSGAANHLDGNSSAHSHNLTFIAPIIEVGAGARILAHATGTFEAGDVTFDAHADASGIDTPIFQLDVVDAEARITLDDVTVTGDDVRLFAVAESTSQFYEDDAPGAAALNFLDGLSEIGGVAVTNAEATLELDSGTSIDANSVELIARAETESKVTTLGTALAVAYGESNPHAIVSLEDNVAINSSGGITIETRAESELDIQAKQGLSPTKAQSDIDVTVAAGSADIKSTIDIAGDATLASAADIDVRATMMQSHNVRSAAAAYEDGAVGGAFAYSTSTTDVHAFMDGTADAAGDVSIQASALTPKNDAASQATVGSGFVATKLIAPQNPYSLSAAVGKFVRVNQPKPDAKVDGRQKIAISAAFTYADHTNNVAARVGDNAAVSAATGSVDVRANIETVPEVSALTTVDSQQIVAGKPGNNTKENSNATAVIVATFNNTTDAHIGQGATVDALGAISVNAETKLPHEIQWFDIDGIGDITDKLNANLGIQNGAFTSWAQSSATGTEAAIAGSLSFNTFNTTSRARISENARINEGLDSDAQHVNVAARNIVEAVHLAGNLGLPFGQTSGGTGVGGAYLQVDYNNVAEAIIHSGSHVSGASLVVRADSTTRDVSLAASGGIADDFAFNGAGSLVRADNRTISRIDDGAVVVMDDGQIVINKEYDYLFSNNDSTDEQPLLTLFPTFDAETAVNGTSDTINLGYEHGLQTGDWIVYSADNGTAIGGLTSGQTYFAIVEDAEIVRLAATQADAQAGNSVALAETATGNQHRLSRGFELPAVDPLNNSINYDHGFADLQPVTYYSGGGPSIGGLVDGETYYVVLSNDAVGFRLGVKKDGVEVVLSVNDLDMVTLDLSNAINLAHTFVGKVDEFFNTRFEDRPLALDTSGDGIVSSQDRDIVSVGESAYQTDLNTLVIAEDDVLLFNFGGGVTKGQNVGAGLTVGINEITRNTQALIGNEETAISDGRFAPGVGVDSAGNIHLGYDHGFVTGDEVVYSSGGGAEIGGLQDGERYVVRRVDATTIQLHRSAAAASSAPETLFGVSDVDDTPNVDAIDLGYVHNYSTGDAVVYRSGGGQAFGGLVDGETYYVVVIDATTVALAESEEAALSSAALAFVPADVDAVEGTIELNVIHGFRTGEAVVYSSDAGSPIAGLVDGQTYFVRVNDNQSIQLALTEEAAKLGTELIDVDGSTATGSHSLRRDVRLALDTSSATGTAHTVQLSLSPSTTLNDAQAVGRALDPTATVDAVNDTIDVGYQHGFSTGQAVVYTNGGGESISGLASGETYFVVVVDATTIQLAVSAADAMAATPVVVAVDATDATGTTHAFGAAFRDQPAVDGASNTIHFGRLHGLTTGDAVTYDSAGGPAIGGLADGATYYAIVVSDATIQLAATEADAIANTPTAIDLDPSTAEAGAHVLRGVDDASGSVISGGNIRVAAINQGLITAPSLAGAFTNETPTGANKTESKQAAAAKTKASKGISVAGDVALNTVRDTTIAAIRDANLLAQSGDATPADIGLTAVNNTNINALSGSVALSSSKKTSAGIAGSYSVNSIDNSTHSVIENSDVDAASGDVYATAANRGRIFSISASGSGVAPGATLSVAGQVSENKIQNTAHAQIAADSTVTAESDIEVSADDTTSIFAISGAANFGGKFGFGASIATNQIGGATTATIDSSQVISGDNLTLSAGTNRDVEAITAAIGASKQGMVAEFGIANNSVATDTQVNLTNIADEQGAAVGGDMIITTADGSTIMAITGGLAAAGNSAGLGAGYGKNSVRNATKAVVDNANARAQGSFDVRSTSDATIKTITVGGTFANNFALGGSLSRNEVQNEIEATIRRSDVAAFNQDALNVDVVATDSSTIQAISGAASIATGGASVGAAIADNIVANSITAAIEDATVHSESGAVVVDAGTTSLIETITVGGAGAQGFALGGSVSLNDVANVVEAHVSGGSTVTATGTIGVSADDTSTIRGIAGGVAVATSGAAVGASLATNDIRNEIKSTIEGSTAEATSGFVTVDASSTAEMQTITAGVGIGQNEISGGVSLNAIANTIDAHLLNATVAAANGARISASDASTIEALAGKAGGGATASFGGAAGFNEIENTLRAYADGSTINTLTGSVEVSAESLATINAISASGSIAGNASIAGSVASSFIGNDVQAYLHQADVAADASVSVVADSHNQIDTFAGAVQVGGSLGIGGTVAVTNSENTTRAHVTDSNVVAAGHGTVDVPMTDSSGGTQSIAGLAVIANAANEISILTGNGSGGGSGAIAATVSVQTTEDTTEAYVRSSNVNSENNGANGAQVVIVAATNDTEVDTKAGSLALAGTAGAGATHDKTVITNTTRAIIDDQSVVNAVSSIDVEAATEERINSITVSGSGAGTAAVAGNVVVTYVDGTTEAYVEDAALVSMGDVHVAATDAVYMGVRENGDRPGIVAGALGVGLAAGGVGGAIGVNTVSNSTTARITDATVDAGNLLSVTADSIEDIVSFAVSGAGGFYLGAAGAVTVNTIKTTTAATIDERNGETAINQNEPLGSANQSVVVAATDNAAIDADGGNVVAGAAAFGAAIDVSTIKNSVAASLGSGIEVTTVRSVEVRASSDKTINSTVVGVGAGVGAVQGSVSVVNVGTATTGQAHDAAANTGDATEDQVGGPAFGDQLGGSAAAQRQKSRSDAKTSSLSVEDEFDPTAIAAQATAATIGVGAELQVGGDLIVDASDTTEVDSFAGAGAAGALGVGGGVSVANLHNQTTALVDRGAILSADGNIAIEANGSIVDTDVAGFAGSAGAVGLGAAVAVLNSHNDVTAALAESAVVDKAMVVLVNAFGTSDLHSDASGASIGAAAAGVMVSDVSEEGTVLAQVGADANVGATPRVIAASPGGVGTLSVRATSDHTVNATGTAAAGGLGAGTGNFATALLDAESRAEVAAGAEVSVSGDLRVQAVADTDVDATGYGVVGGVVLAAGATSATATATPTVVTSIGADTDLLAGDDVIIGASAIVDANSAATGASGGAFTGAAVNATTTVTSDAQVDIRTRSKITARDTVDVKAETRIDADSTSTSRSIAGAALGDSSAETIVNAETIVDLEALAELIGRATAIQANVTRLNANATALFDSTISVATLAEAKATNTVNSLVEIVNRGTHLAGYDRLDLVARQSGIVSNTNAMVDAGIVPLVSSISQNNVNLNSNIDVRAGSVLRGTNVFVEARSFNLAGYQIDAEVDSVTIRAFEDALAAAQDLLAGAQVVLSLAQDALTAAQSAVTSATNWLAQKQNELNAAQQAINNFIDDACGWLGSGTAYHICVDALYALTSGVFWVLRQTLSAAQSAVNAAANALADAQALLATASAELANAQSALTAAQNDVDGAFASLFGAFDVETHGTANRNNSVKLNGDLYTGVIVDRLTVNPDGTLSGGGSGIVGAMAGDTFELSDILIDNLVPQNGATLVVNSIGGSLAGNLAVHENVGLAGLTIDNNSDQRFQVNDIDPTSPRTVPLTVITNAGSGSLSTPTSTASVTPEITIGSESSANVVFAGLVDAANGTIAVQTVGDVIVEGALRTTGTMSVRSLAGSILGNAASGPQVIASSLSLAAESGNIGSAAAALRTAVQGLIDAVAANLIAIKEEDGQLNIRATAANDVRLEAANHISGRASAQNIELTASSGSIGTIANPFRVQHGGTVSAAADQDIHLEGDDAVLTLGNFQSSAGNIDVTTADDLRLTGALSAQNIQLQSDASLRIEGNASINANPASGVVAIHAGQDLLMSSAQPVMAHRIEASAGHDLYLRTSANELAIDALGSGELEIHETDDLTVERAINAAGTVRIVAGGALAAINVQSLADLPGSFVGLIARGDITVGNVQAGLTNGQVSLSAAGNISESANTDPEADVAAALVMMNASGTIDVQADAGELHEFGDGKRIRINTDRSLELFLNAVADIFVIADGNITATHVETAGLNINLKSNGADVRLRDVTTTHHNGRIRVQANGTDEAGNIVQVISSSGNTGTIAAARSIDLRAKGDILLTGDLQAAQSNIFVSAGDSITATASAAINAGGILRAMTRTGDIELQGDFIARRNVDIRSKGAVTLGGQVSSDESNISISATTDLLVTASADIQSANLFRATTRLGEVDVAGAITATRQIDIRSKKQLMLQGTLLTEQKDIRLRADDELKVAAAATISAGNNADLRTRWGNIEIAGIVIAGTFDSRATRGNINIDAGGQAFVTGVLDPLGEVSIKERLR